MTGNILETDTIFRGFENVVQYDVRLAPLTWYRLGGPAKYVIRPENPDQLRDLSRRCVENGIRVLVLGLGANLLVADEGVNAAVFKLDAPYWTKFTTSNNRLYVGAGSDMQAAARFCVRNGLSGIESMAGIPGTVGGCIRGNSGGKFGDIGAVVSRVSVMSVEGEAFDRTEDDLVFSYRKSNIAATFILSAELALQEDDPDELVKKFKEIWMFKKNSQPLNTKNAGCIFKNPRDVSAGLLIDRAGLKGARVGNAEVSTKHANFIIAHPGCRSADIIELIQQIKAKVRDVHGIDLEEEVVVWR